MPTGTVKWFSLEKGFGFITPDEQGNDVYIHLNTVKAANLDTLVKGQKVEYTTKMHGEKPAAQSVMVVATPERKRFVPKPPAPVDINDFEEEWGLRRS